MKKIIASINNQEIINLTNEEISIREIEKQNILIEKTIRKEKQLEEKANKQSALNKLKALGLNDAEIKAIIGI